MTTLYHYTCDHGRAAIGDCGYLRMPAHDIKPDSLADELARWIWLTDMAIPDRNALGLTSHILECDRLAHRYRVNAGPLVFPWTKVRRLASPAVREGLESAPGARPRHWYVTRYPLAAVLDPICACDPSHLEAGAYDDGCPDHDRPIPALSADVEQHGMCTACGSVEVKLTTVSGVRDLSQIGESSSYPTGYGCEVCA